MIAMPGNPPRLEQFRPVDEPTRWVRFSECAAIGGRKEGVSCPQSTAFILHWKRNTGDCCPVSDVRNVTDSPGKTSRMGNVIKPRFSDIPRVSWKPVR